MEPNSSIGKSDVFNFRYTNSAVPNFNWKNHKHKISVETSKLNIFQALETELKDSKLTFHIKESSQAAFSKSSVCIYDAYNVGPFLDKLCYSFKPLNIKAARLLEDSHPATSVKCFERQTNTAQAVNVLGNLPFSAYSHQKGTNVTSKTQEFELSKPYGFPKFQMKLCYDERDPVDYNVDDLSTLRCSHHGKRVGIAFIPFFGWFGGWKIMPDTIYNVPDVAKTSFAADWHLQYKIEDFQDLQFEWSTEVRTVFASNDSNTILWNDCGNYVNWIKTVHKITHIFKICVDEEGKLTVETVGRSIKVLSSTGYDTTTRDRDLLHNQDHSTTEDIIRLHKTHKNNQSEGLTPTKILSKEEAAKLFKID